MLYRGIRGRQNDERRIAIYGCRRWRCEKLSAIAKRYGCDSHSYISNVVQRVVTQIETDKKFAQIINQIKKMVFKK